MQGSSDAYARLVNRYQQEIASQVWKYAQRPEVMEELVHDVFVEAYLSLRTFRGDAPFLHWLRKIAVRVGYRYWKSEARRRAQMPVPTTAAAATPTEVGQHEAADAAAQLYAVLERLSPRDRAVITLIHLKGAPSPRRPIYSTGAKRWSRSRRSPTKAQEAAGGPLMGDLERFDEWAAAARGREAPRMRRDVESRADDSADSTESRG